ncbi:MAG: hypothetical protein HRT74_04575 [Flavobacteriales bacterium]|nr:hypothetical protein [Flavobacteriales bacterium]
MADNRKKVRETLLKDLFSADEKLVLRSIERAKKHADVSFIEPLLLVQKEGSEIVAGKVDEILSEIKMTDAEDALMYALKDDRFKAQQGNILRYLWSSGFEPSHQLATIVNVAIEGDYMTALEGYTLIEQFSGAVDDDQLMQSLVDLRLALNDMDREDDKFTLLQSMHAYLDDLEKNQ